MQRTLVILALILCPALAKAGAWMREPGQTFVSFSTSSDIQSGGGLRFDDGVSIFVDHGLRPGLTIGATGWSTGKVTEVMAFAALPVATQSRDNWAITLGLGGYRDRGQANRPIVQLAASWGRGFVTSLGSGWIEAETSITRRMRPGLTVFKANLTLGLSHSEKGKVIVQVFTSKEGAGAITAKLAPSYALRISGRTEVVFGGTFGVVGDRTRQVSIGTWMSF